MLLFENVRVTPQRDTSHFVSHNPRVGWALARSFQIICIFMQRSAGIHLGFQVLLDLELWSGDIMPSSISGFCMRTNFSLDAPQAFLPFSRRWLVPFHPSSERVCGHFRKHGFARCKLVHELSPRLRAQTINH